MDFNKILIAVDDGPTAEKIASIGFQLGQRLNSEIALVSIADTTFNVTAGNVTPSEMTEIIKGDLKRKQQMLLDNVFKNYKVWTFVEEGKPFEMILKVAEEWQANLIVIGTHGRVGFSHLLMGSVAEKIIRHSTRPVIVIPTR